MLSDCKLTLDLEQYTWGEATDVKSRRRWQNFDAITA